MSDFPIQTGKQLSTHLRALRKNLDLTQAQLGVRLGVEQARIGKIERNPGSISVDQLLELLAALEANLLLRPKTRTRAAADRKVEW